jgi:hypothetical protein
VDQVIFLAGAMILSAVLGHWLWLGLSKRRSRSGSRGAVDLIRSRLMQWSIEGLLDADALSRLQCRLDQEVTLNKSNAAKSRELIPESWRRFLHDRGIPVADFWYSVLGIATAAIGLKMFWPITTQGPLVRALLVFSGTLLLFSAARYSLHEWRWRGFGHAILLVVTLLVPVNFVLLSRLTSARIELLLGVGMGISLIAILTWIGREFLPGDRSLFAMVVGGTALSQLLWPRLVYLVSPSAGPLLMVAACLPVACHGAGLRRVFRADMLQILTARSARGMVYLLATGTFAVLVALLFLASEMGHVSGSAANLQAEFALPLALMAVPLLLVGMSMSCEISLARHFAPLRWCGAIASAMGGASLLAALGLAWHHPLLLVMVATIGLVLLSRIALRHHSPWLHAPALTCLTLVLLLGYHGIRGHLRLLQNSGAVSGILLSQESGMASMAIATVLWAGRGRWLRHGRAGDAAWYAGVACVVAACGLLVESVPSRAMQFSGQASLVFGFYGAALLAANRRWRQAFLTSIGMSLLVGSLLWLLWLVAPARSDFWSLVLAGTALIVAIVGTRFWIRVDWRKSHGEPIARSAQALGLLALTAAGYTLYSDFNYSWTVALSVGTVAATWAVVGAFGRGATLLRGACVTALAAIAIALGAWGLSWDQGVAIWTLLASASLMLLMASAVTHVTLLTRSAKCRGILMAFGRLLSLAVPALLVLSVPMPLGRFTVAWLWLALLWYMFAEAAGSTRLRLCWQSALFVAAVGLANIALSNHALVAQVPTLNVATVDIARLKAAGIGLATLASAFALARAFLYRFSGSRLLARLPALDWGMLCLLVAVLAFAGIWTEVCALARPLMFIPSQPTWGTDGVWLLSLTALSLIVSLWTSRARHALRGLLVVAFVGMVAAINGAAPSNSAHLCLGWAVPIFSLLVLALTWSRTQIQSVATRLHLGPIRRWHRGVPAAAMICCVPVLLMVTAIAFFTSDTAVQAAFANTLVLAGPTILVAMGLVVTALIEGSAVFMSGSLLAFVIAAITGLLWRAHHAAGLMGGTVWPHLAARLFQISGIITAVGSLAWLAWIGRRELPSPSNAERRAVTAWSLIGPISSLVLISTSTMMMLHAFPMSGAWIHWIGSRWSWWLVGLSTLSWLALAREERRLLDPRIFMIWGLAILALGACTIERLAPGGGWGYRALILLWASPALVGWLRGPALSKVVAAPSHWVQSAIFWSRIGVAASVLLGLHAAFQM